MIDYMFEATFVTNEYTHMNRYVGRQQEAAAEKATKPI
jgi:hypothetical protein